MPILTPDQIIARLEGRIAELEAGAEIAKKHILALLTTTQQQALEAALAAQVELKKDKRARTEDEKQDLGWKTIREVRLEILKQALNEARNGMKDAFEGMQQKAQVRQMRIYMDAIKTKLAECKDLQVAKNWANNELTRAGLARMDGQIVGHANPRDSEVRELEDALRARFKSEMTADELEQQEMLEDLNQVEKKRKVGKRSGVERSKK